MHLVRRLATRVIPRARDWRTAGHPPPPSLLDDHPDPPDLTEHAPALTHQSETISPPLPPPLRIPTPAIHAAHRATLKAKFPTGWSPPRKLSREAMDGLRLLHRTDPDTFTTPILADRFRISPEAVRRILKSKWVPTREEQARLARREREQKEEVRRKRIEEERMRALEIEKEVYERDRERWRAAGGKRERIRGLDSKDVLTFQ